MKIEKINENQIRCTLTREDLESHQVKFNYTEDYFFLNLSGVF